LAQPPIADDISDHDSREVALQVSRPAIVPSL
jgi:hypothetical protein